MVRTMTEPIVRRPARAGTAQGSKIAAAGFGLAAMLGLVGAMGYASRASASKPDHPEVTVPPAQVLVVIHPADATGTTTPTAEAPEALPALPASPAPIVLEARPTVRPAPVSQAPVGQTNASR